MRAFCRIGSLPGDEGCSAVKVAITIDVEARDHPCREGQLLRMPSRRSLPHERRRPCSPKVAGWRAAPTDDELAALGAEGMVVGLHGHTHRRFTELTGEEIDRRDRRVRKRRCARPGSSPSARCSASRTSAGTPMRSCSRAWPRSGWWHIDCDAVAYDWKDELREQPQRVADNAIDDMEQSSRAPAPTARSCSSTAGRTRHRKRSRSSSTMRTRRATTLVALTDVPRRAWNRPVVL